MPQAYTIIENNIQGLAKQRKFEIKISNDTALVGAEFAFDSLDLATISCRIAK